MSTSIKVDSLSKIYRLGEIGTGTLSQDLHRWFTTQVLKREDPFLKIGQDNDRTTRGDNDIVYSLQDINFEIKQGEAIGIIGRNGAGKSTLLKILSRITSPSTGKINIKGRVASLLEVGTGFHPELTGRENIYLNGAILGMRKKEITRKLDEIIDFSGVERYIDTPVKRYSSGMYVRLAFAVAAHLESEILIIDEVLAVGDAEFQRKCLGKMNEVSKGDGRTVLFVSHNMGAIHNLCKEVIVLSNGNLVFKGNTEEGIHFYQDLSLGKTINEVKTSVYSNKIELVNHTFYNQKGLNIHSGSLINIGDKLELELTLQVNSLVKDLHISLDIKNTSEELIAHITNEDGELILTNCQSGIFKIKISTDSIFFIPGVYFISLYIGEGHKEAIIRSTNVFQFEIQQSSIVKRNHPLPKHSKVFLNSQWKILN